MLENNELCFIKDQLESLQTQFAFQEDTITALNDVVVRQQIEIEQLKEQGKHLKLLLDNTLTQLDSGGVEERPPHY
jgi:SlyX protein